MLVSVELIIIGCVYGISVIKFSQIDGFNFYSGFSFYQIAHFNFLFYHHDDMLFWFSPVKRCMQYSLMWLSDLQIVLLYMYLVSLGSPIFSTNKTITLLRVYYIHINWNPSIFVLWVWILLMVRCTRYNIMW